MGPLLIIFVGLALFAFIAGDAWKILQPHQSQEVGEVNGETLSAQDYQALVEEYTDVVKFAQGNTSMGEAEQNQIRDEVWNTYVRNKLIEDEAAKIGLTVSNAELQAVISAGRNQMLQQTPFRNQQTGAFDKDLLNNFLLQYEQNKTNAQFVEQYRPLYNYWKFIEKSLKQGILAEKYQGLIMGSFISNPVAAQYAFDARNTESDLLLAAYPYNAINDTAVTVSEAELKKAYNRKKEQFVRYAETRDIQYVSLQVKPSQEDNQALKEEVTEYARALEQNEIPDISNFMHQTSSTVAYSEVPFSKNAYPSDIAIRLDSIMPNSVYGPYYNAGDDSYNVIKVLSKAQYPDSIQYRQIVAAAQTADATALLADSIMDALKNGASFEELSKRYGQQGTGIWITSANYEGSRLIEDNAKFLNTLMGMKKGERTMLSLNQSQAKLIIEVMDSRNPIDKYKALVIKRPVEFSRDTYNSAYNDFSQFVATCNTVEDFAKYAEEKGYRVQELPGLANNVHNIADIPDTHEALRWAFAAKENEISPLYECGDNDNLLVVGLVKINEKGYQSLGEIQNILRTDLLKEKKAARILPQMSGDFAALQNIKEVKMDTVKHVTYSAPAFISMTASREPAISARAAQMTAGEISTPIQGEGGVYVIKVITQIPRNQAFVAENEESTLKNSAVQGAGRFLNELYIKANVTDSRYLYF